MSAFRVGGALICLLLVIFTVACDGSLWDPSRGLVASNVYKEFADGQCSQIADAIWDGDSVAVARLVGSDPSIVKLACGKSKKTPLHLAVTCKELAITRILVEAGADPSSKALNGKSAMYYATLVEDNCAIIKYLSANGGDPNRVEVPLGPFETPFLFAVGMEHSNVSCLLENGATINPLGRPEANAIAEALFNYDFDIVILLINHPTADVDAPVLDAALKDTVRVDWYVDYARKHFRSWLDSPYQFDVTRGQEAMKKLDEIEQLIAERRRSKREQK